MVNLAYKDWETMYSEAMVRAAVIIYPKDHGTAQQKIDKEIKSQMELGFIWMQVLVDQPEEYRSKREHYQMLKQLPASSLTSNKKIKPVLILARCAVLTYIFCTKKRTEQPHAQIFKVVPR